MLKQLHIKDFVLIDELDLGFAEGLNLVTGETGAGKSLLVDALQALLGSRAPGDLVRTGRSVAVVEALFDVSANKSEVGAILAEHGIEDARLSDLSVRREINASGRSRVFINDQLLSIGALKQIKPYLATIQSQGEQLGLFDPETQLVLLDEFAGCEESRERVAEAYSGFQAAQLALRDLMSVTRERLEREDFLRFQLDELVALGAEADEEDELQNERSLLSHAERAHALALSAYSALYEDDDSVVSRLSSIERLLNHLSALDERVNNSLDEVRSSVASLSEIGQSLRTYADGIDQSGERLEQVENRLAEIERLKRKHSTDFSGLLLLRKDLESRLVEFENLATREEELRATLSRAASEYKSAALELSRARIEAAPEFSRIVSRELSGMALEKARFEARLEVRKNGHSDEIPGEGEAEIGASSASWSRTGIDDLRFFFSANPGESLRSIADVASGGELSRIFLVLQTLRRRGARSSTHGGPLIVFDEIDVGIGGRVAEAVGQRLKDLSKSRQVLCVTHQPQIARFAESHFVVEKITSGGRTKTTVVRVEGEARDAELVRMVGGRDDADSLRVVKTIFGPPQTNNKGGRKAT